MNFLSQRTDSSSRCAITVDCLLLSSATALVRRHKLLASRDRKYSRSAIRCKFIRPVRALAIHCDLALKASCIARYYQLIVVAPEVYKTTHSASVFAT